MITTAAEQLGRLSAPRAEERVFCDGSQAFLPRAWSFRERKPRNANVAPQHRDLAPRLPEQEPKVPSKIRESGGQLREVRNWIVESQREIRESRIWLPASPIRSEALGRHLHDSEPDPRDADLDPQDAELAPWFADLGREVWI